MIGPEKHCAHPCAFCTACWVLAHASLNMSDAHTWRFWHGVHGTVPFQPPVTWKKPVRLNSPASHPASEEIHTLSEYQMCKASTSTYLQVTINRRQQVIIQCHHHSRAALHSTCTVTLWKVPKWSLLYHGNTRRRAPRDQHGMLTIHCQRYRGAQGRKHFKMLRNTPCCVCEEVPPLLKT